MMQHSTAFIHSIQTLGTLDGPGVRFVAFLQGCPLRCGCCHNPDTWACREGRVYTAQELLAYAERYRAYFGEAGGVTLSGGEPLLQDEFCHAFFAGCREKSLHTCLDTAGCFWGDGVEKVLQVTDRVLLDIKYSTDALYHEYVGCSIDAPLQFLQHLNEMGVPTTLRSVIIPTLNDNDSHARFLRDLADAHACVDGVELLPFRKICETKYESMGIPFRFAHLPTPDHETMAHLQGICSNP